LYFRSYSPITAVRRARTQFENRALSVCGPEVWNSLPTALRNIDSYPDFRRALCFLLITVIPYIH